MIPGFETAHCPRCGGTEGHVIARGPDRLHRLPGIFSAAECRMCGLWFQNPRPTVERLAELYPDGYVPHGAPEGQDGGRAMVARHVAPSDPEAAPVPAPQPRRWVPESYLQRRLGYPEDGLGRVVRRLPLFDPWERRRHGVALTPRFVPGGRLLEIGCADGARLRLLRHMGWRDLHGIELVPAAAERARNSGFSVETGRAEEALGRTPDGAYDAVVCSMVLEHLHDPFGFLPSISAKLKPGGELLFSTVVRDAIDAWVFGEYWSGFDFPRHMVFFRTADLRSALAPSFDRVETFHQNEPIDVVRSAGWRRGPLDGLLATVAASAPGRVIGEVLAWARLTGRVSFRCRRRTGGSARRLPAGFGGDERSDIVRRDDDRW